jgi:hypothetical protein
MRIVNEHGILRAWVEGRYQGCAIECNTSFLNQAISIAVGLLQFYCQLARWM